MEDFTATMDGASESNSRLLPTQQWKTIIYRYYKILVLQPTATSVKVGVVGPGFATATFH